MSEMNWISVKERLPTKEECKQYSGWFMIFRPFQGRPDLSRYDAHEEYKSYDHGWKYPNDRQITHWMHLPDSPTDVGNYNFITGNSDY